MKAVILAAWFGTRMLPINKSIPKELLPVGDKPVIQYAIESLVRAWIDDILIITSQWKKSLEDYFDKSYELEEKLKLKWKDELLELINKPKNLANFAFVKQKEPLGTWHAILQAKPRISDDFFVVVNADMIYKPEAFEDMMKLHNETKKPVWLLKDIDRKEAYKYWMAKIENDMIVDIIEKPELWKEPSKLMNTWTFIRPQEAFELLAKTNPEPNWEIYPWFAAKHIMEKYSILPCITDGLWDIGNHKTRLDANVHLYKNGTLF